MRVTSVEGEVVRIHPGVWHKFQERWRKGTLPMTEEGRPLCLIGARFLIKAVAQSMPSYSMSCFRLPDCMLKEIQAAFANFWWQSSEDHRGIHWLGWHKLTTSKMAGGLGFRDLKAFNLALLAKQAWRLLSQPDLLISKVFKGLYYPDRPFLEARVGTSPSFSWRSIMEARNYIQAGMKWRIGDGSHVSVWKDNWLPAKGRGAPYIRGYHHESDNDLVVGALIDHDLMAWDVSALIGLFSQEDAEMISGIPLGRGRHDVPIWPYTRHNDFTVRSCYYFILQLWQQDTPSSSTQQVSTAVVSQWRALWSLQVPPKVKSFAWRLCHNVLPTPSNLHRRCVDVDNACPVCGALNGDPLHLFVECPIARQVWALSNIFSLVRPDVVVNVQQWMSSVLSFQAQEVREVFVVCLWTLWNNRNGAFFEGRRTAAASLVRSVFSLYQQFKDANCRVVAQQELVEAWEVPPSGWCKLNVDALCREGGRGTIAMILRDDQGLFLKAKTCLKLGVQDVALLEALAILSACEWGSALNLVHLLIESDAKLVVQSCSRKGDLSYTGVVAAEAGQLIEEHGWRVRWIPRAANNAAHQLAAHQHLSDSNLEWNVVPPCFLDPILMMDLPTL